MLLKRGVVVPLPPTAPANETRFPRDIGFQYLDEILRTMRDTSVHGLYHALKLEHCDQHWRALRKRFETLASFFESEMHTFGLSMLVRAAHADGDVDGAKSYIHRALERIANDQTLPESVRTTQSDEIRVLLRDFD